MIYLPIQYEETVESDIPEIFFMDIKTLPLTFHITLIDISHLTCVSN